MEVTSDNDDASKDELRCFVCDANVQDRYYALATCRTRNSRSRVIEKLGELVGERYMVVISEDDIICRSCANLVNTLDRLETEMRNARDNILRFLEQKYSLEEGELLCSSEKPKPCQPPQITKCNTKEVTNYCTKQSKIDLESYARDKTRRKKLYPWLQCDKCRYITPFNSFIMRHIKGRIKQRIFCDKCGLYVPDSRKGPKHNCTMIQSENKENEKDTCGTVDNSTETSLALKTMQQQRESLAPIPAYNSPRAFDESLPPPLVDLSNPDHLYVSNILSSEDGPTSLPQPIYVRVLQQVDMNDTDMVNEMNDEKVMRISRNEVTTTTQTGNEAEEQALVLTEDGDLKVIEIAYWNEARESDAEPAIMFQ